MYGKVYPNARTITDAQYAAIAVPEILGFDWGADFAEADPDVCIGVKIAGKEIYLREYYYSNSGSDEDIADAIISAKIPAGTRGVYDPATAGDIRARKIASHLISKAGLKLRLFPASKGSIMSGIRAMSDYTLCITQESKNIQYEQEHYAYGVDDAHGSIAPVDRDNHAMDALRYVFDAWALSGGRL